MKPFSGFALFSLLLFNIASYSAYCQTELYFEHLSTQQGLSQNSVWSICQDKEGFMWFGTQDGLNKYDGYTFTVLKPDPKDPEHTLHHNTISDIHEDRKGRLWVTTFGGGFHQVNKHTGEVIRYGIKPTNTTHWNVLFSIHEDKKGMLWVCGAGGVARFNPETKKFTLFSNEFIFGFYSIVEDASGRIWAGGVEGVYLLDQHSGKFTSVPLDSSLARQPNCRALLLDKRGTLWAGTDREGLFGLNTKSNSSQFTRYNPGGLLNKNIRFNGLYEDSKGYIWLISTEGLQRLDPKDESVINFHSNPSEPGSISHQIVASIFEDRIGTLWVGTDNGVNKVSPSYKKFNSYQIIPALPYVIVNQNSINAIVADESGTIWIGSDRESFYNGLFRFNTKHKQFTSIQADPKNPSQLASNSVLSIYQDTHNRLWIGTKEALYLLDRITEKFTRYSSDVQVKVITEDRDSKLWLGGGERLDGGIASFNLTTGKFTYYKHNPQDTLGLRDPNVWGIVASRSGDIWVALSGAGIDRLNQQTGTFTHYLSNPAGVSGFLNDKDVRCLYEDAQGIIWAGTNQGGLHRLDPESGKFTYFTTLDGLPSNHVVSIMSDEKGNLWLGTNQGLSRFDPRTKTFRNFTISDGLPSNEFQIGSVHKRNGKLLFGTVNGFVVFHPDSIGNNTNVPPVYITGFKVLEKSRDLLKNQIELPYDENFLSFDFVALNYTAPEKNQYAFQLEGVDQQWIYSGTRRFASYTDLRPGTYTFRVKASNNDGIWNEKGTSIQITILRPWWHTTWAYLFYGLCFLAGLVAVDRFQRRRLMARERERTRERELAQARELEKAYHQLGQQKEELQTTLEDLQATQSQLIQREKMASLGELTAGIAHEIQNPLNFVNNFSEVSQELCGEIEGEANAGNTQEVLSITADLKQNLEKIHHHGKRADSIVKGMLQHSRASSGEKQPTDINALVDEYLRLAYHGLRAKDKDFNADFKLEAEPALGKIEVVPQEIGRVLLNLFNNAFYATQQKKASLNGQYQPQVTVTTKRVGNKVEINVKDNGIGIPESIRQKIFQPFFTTKPTGEGTGLGLSLSYDIITKGHGGELTVDSKERVGSEFVIILPIHHF